MATKKGLQDTLDKLMAEEPCAEHGAAAMEICLECLLHRSVRGM